MAPVRLPRLAFAASALWAAWWYARAGQGAGLLAFGAQDRVAFCKRRARRHEVAKNIDACLPAVAKRLHLCKACEIARHGVRNDILKRLPFSVQDLKRVIEVSHRRIEQHAVDERDGGHGNRHGQGEQRLQQRGNPPFLRDDTEINPYGLHAFLFFLLHAPNAGSNMP